MVIINKKSMVKFVAILCCCFFVASVYAKNKTEKKLDKIKKEIYKEKRRKKSLDIKKRKVEKEINSIQKKTVKIARNVKIYEKKLDVLESNLETLEQKKSRLEKEIDVNNVKTYYNIAVMQKLSMTPFQLLFLNLELNQNIFRNSTISMALVGYLKVYNENLGKKLNEVSSVEKRIVRKQSKIKRVSSSIQKQRKDMNKLLRRKKYSQEKINRNRKVVNGKLRKLAKQSRNLSELIKKINSRKKKYSNKHIKGRNFMGLKKKLPLPLSGRITQKFGGRKKSGVKSKGIKIMAARNTDVLAPYDGVVIFAGDFKGYGRTLIIDHGKNYYSVLAGLNQIKTNEGQSLMGGEPVGNVAKKKNIYMEFRYKNKPINPLKYFYSN